MLLCDIGNTSYHFFDGVNSYKKNINSFEPQSIQKKVCFISVNAEISSLLNSYENWIDLAPFVNRKNYYETMGIDRIFAVEALQNAVVVDAGSAVTVDVVREATFEGGFIYPGVNAMAQTYANISPALAYSFNFECDLDIMPKNSQDAISYGYLKTLYNEVVSYNLPIILTGGDAREFKKIFKDATVNEMLLFDSMKKIIKKANIC